MTDFQPPLTRWGHTWRLLVVLLICAVVWLPVVDDQSDTRFVVDLAAGLCGLVLMWWRRRWPLAIAVLTALLTAVSGIAAGPATLAAVSLATRRRWRELVLIFMLSLASAEIYQRLNPDVAAGEPWWFLLLLNIFVMAAILGWGMYLGSRRELLYRLKERALRAEEQQELRAAQSRLAERGRIAREMHDVLAHRISQLSMRAAAMEYRHDLDADQLRTEAGELRATAQQALNELRGVLGVLRDASGDLIDRPQPTYADLPQLVEQATTAGQAVSLRDDVVVDVDDAVPAATGRTLYRIVQECLTNAHKHSTGARVEIVLRGDAESGVDFEISNPLGFRATADPVVEGAGLGLIGLAERAELSGGRLTSGVRDGRFRVAGWLPWVS